MNNVVILNRLGSIKNELGGSLLKNVLNPQMVCDAFSRVLESSTFTSVVMPAWQVDVTVYNVGILMRMVIHGILSTVGCSPRLNATVPAC